MKGIGETIERLLARISIAEERATACPPWPWRVWEEDDEVVMAADDIQVTEAYALSGQQTRAVARHIAANDPGAALTAIAVDRLIIRLYQQAPSPELLEAVLAVAGKYET